MSLTFHGSIIWAGDVIHYCFAPITILNQQPSSTGLKYDCRANYEPQHPFILTRPSTLVAFLSMLHYTGYGHDHHVHDYHWSARSPSLSERNRAIVGGPIASGS